MKRAFLMLAAAVLVAGLSGCLNTEMYRVPRDGPGLTRGTCRRCPDLCQNCRPGRRGRSAAEAFDPGAPMGTVAYPYYTIRGPRDFLTSDPPSIGP